LRFEVDPADELDEWSELNNTTDLIVEDLEVVAAEFADARAKDTLVVDYTYQSTDPGSREVTWEVYRSADKEWTRCMSSSSTILQLRDSAS
jgi:hypothetical protein